MNQTKPLSGPAWRILTFAGSREGWATGKGHVQSPGRDSILALAVNEHVCAPAEMQGSAWHFHAMGSLEELKCGRRQQSGRLKSSRSNSSNLQLHLVVSLSTFAIWDPFKSLRGLPKANPAQAACGVTLQSESHLNWWCRAPVLTLLPLGGAAT